MLEDTKKPQVFQSNLRRNGICRAGNHLCNSSVYWVYSFDYFEHMIRQLSRTTAFGAILLLLITSPLIEIAHQDAILGGSGSGAAFTQHMCGDRERHIPLDQLHGCTVCAQQTQRISTLPSPPLSITSSVIFFAGLPDQLGDPTCASYLFSGKRGPPL